MINSHKLVGMFSREEGPFSDGSAEKFSRKLAAEVHNRSVVNLQEVVPTWQLFDKPRLLQFPSVCEEIHK